MAHEAGGISEKFGNRYEANWVAYQLLQLLNEKILSVIVEPIGDDEVGVDVIIEHHNGEKEYHQCKSSNANSEYWLLSKLNQEKEIQEVNKFLRYYIGKPVNSSFHRTRRENVFIGKFLKDNGIIMCQHQQTNME